MLPPKVPMVPEAQGTDVVPVSRDGGERWRVSLFQIRKWLLASGIAGSPGPQGDPGPKGDPGTPGKDGLNGTNGRDGTNGKDGLAGTNGTHGAPGKDGTNGAPGKDGTAGKDAASLLGTITIGETIALAVTLAGIRRVAITTPSAWGVTASQSLIAVPIAAVPLGYAVHDVIATADNKISVAVSVPALAIGAVYSIPCKLHRLTS